MFDLTTLQTNTDLESSVVTLISSIANELEAAKDSPEMVQAFADWLRASSESLANAVIANVTSFRFEPLPAEPEKPAAKLAARKK